MRIGRLTGPRRVRPTKAVRAAGRRGMDRSRPGCSSTCKLGLLGVTNFFSQQACARTVTQPTYREQVPAARRLFGAVPIVGLRSVRFDALLAAPLLLDARLLLFSPLAGNFLEHDFHPLADHSLASAGGSTMASIAATVSG